MLKSIFLIFGSVILLGTAQAQQTCFESQPPQLKFSCESGGDNVYLRVELIDVTNAAISKNDVYMGSRLFGSDEGLSTCESQLKLLKAAIKLEDIHEPKLIALCENIEAKLIRIVLRPLAPYITKVDQRRTSNLENCIQEMNEINTHQ